MTERTIDSYFAVFQNFGEFGLEANVHPEETRRDIVKMLASGEFRNVVCIHKIEAGRVLDVTAELFAEARLDRMDSLSEWADELSAN